MRRLSKWRGGGGGGGSGITEEGEGAREREWESILRSGGASGLGSSRRRLTSALGAACKNEPCHVAKRVLLSPPTQTELSNAVCRRRPLRGSGLLHFRHGWYCVGTHSQK